MLKVYNKPVEDLLVGTHGVTAQIKGAKIALTAPFWAVLWQSPDWDDDKKRKEVA